VAGIRPGDVIVGFNSTAVTDPSQLFRLATDAKIGSQVTLKVLRGGRPLEFRLTIVSDSRARRQ
jgi:S1-C subfamily serine protease